MLCSTQPLPSHPAVAIIAAVSTGVESLPISQRLDDNLSVPAVALLLGSTLLP